MSRSKKQTTEPSLASSTDVDIRFGRFEIGALAAVLATALVWANWTSLAAMARKWAHDPQYSHGYLVPLFSVVLLWLRRDLLEYRRLRPSWWGLPILLIGIAMRLGGAYYYYEWFEFLSLIPCVTGLLLLVGGWPAIKWAWPAIGFLVFMIPLPYRLEGALRGPLRSIGTRASTYMMQTIGLPALAEGNVVVVGDVRVGVNEACSGLRMLMIFFALSTAVALLSDRPLWERAVIVLSAVPIALVTNITRITATGLLYATGQEYLADLVFHDLAGWLMMPFALVLLGIELKVLSRLFLVETRKPMAVGLAADVSDMADAVPNDKGNDKGEVVSAR